MRGWITSGLGLLALSGAIAGPVQAQIVERERDVTITGPGGRTLERQIRTERGPGFVDRQVQIHRPGGSFRQEVFAQRMPGHLRGGPGPVLGGFAPGPRGFIERDVIIDRRGPGWGPALALGGGLFGLGMLAGSSLASPPPPPPVVLAPAPAPVVVVPAEPVVPAPVVVYNPPQRYVQAAPAPAVVADPVADALGRLRSSHDHSRRDGALTLGRLGDPRAVPALVDRLKNDYAREVRVASAWALAEIGDPRAAVPLQSAALFDRRKDVRDAATEAYRRLPRENAAPAASPAEAEPDPAPGPTMTSRAPTAYRSAETPPPPPTPVEPPFRRPSAGSGSVPRTAQGFPDSP